MEERKIKIKTLVVYYSMSGDVKSAAERIAKETGADILRLETVAAYPEGTAARFVICGKSALEADKPELKKYEIDLSKYHQIIIGTPIWAATYTPPVGSFMAKENLTDKKIYLYASSASGNADKCFGKMKEALGCMENIPTLSLVDPKKKKNINNNNNKEKIEEFCKIIQKDCEL